MALDFLAGCVGGCAGITVGYPFDTVKVRLQTQDMRNPNYKGTLDCFRSIVHQNSVVGLYKGLSSPLSGIAVVNAIGFGSYGNIQRRMPDPDALWTHVVAGACSGLAQSFVATPLELAKTRLQLAMAGTHQAITGPLDCLRGVWRVEGISGVYRGLGVTISREVPAFGIYFATYEWLTRAFASRRVVSKDELPPWVLLVSGGMSGAASWLFTYPIDVVKSRVQADASPDGRRRFRGAWHCTCVTYAQEGMTAFWRGLCATLIRSFPTNAATFLTVAYVLKLGNFVTSRDDSRVSTGSQILERAEAAFASYGVVNATSFTD